MSENKFSFDADYSAWIAEISDRYRKTQIKAAVSVNRELIAFYWSLGRDIVDMQAENRWGSSFYDRLSKDLASLLPGVKGFAVSNLRYVKRFYSMYCGQNCPQVVGEITENELFSIPWGHHRLIIDKCKGDINMAVFFVKKTIQNNWSRSVLMNFLSTDLYSRQVQK